MVMKRERFPYYDHDCPICHHPDDRHIPTIRGAACITCTMKGGQCHDKKIHEAMYEMKDEDLHV